MPETGSVYLDYNATAPLRPATAEAVAAALSVTGNPSSVHGYGRRARRLLEDARESVAALIGATPGEILFTSGGTEANTLALHGIGRQRLLVSAGEHASVLEAVPDAEVVALRPDGRLDLEDLAARLALSDVPALISVMLANNETGVIQPVEAVVALARAQGAVVHCDAVQAAGKVPVDFGALGVDLMSLSAHKLGGPQGVGALVVRDGVTLTPVLRGGGQERRRRAGTENLPGIAGFGAAAAAAKDALAAFAALESLRDELERRVQEIAAGVVCFGATVPRLANTSCLTMPGVAAETQVMALDLDGIAVSAGAACSSGKVQSSHVLAAMGVPAAAADCAIRVSLGWQSAAADVDAFVAAWRRLYARRRAAARDVSTAA